MVRKAVTVYNNIRPHQALGMDTPARAAEVKKMTPTLAY